MLRKGPCWGTLNFSAPHRGHRLFWHLLVPQRRVPSAPSFVPGLHLWDHVCQQAPLLDRLMSGWPPGRQPHMGPGGRLANQEKGGPPPVRLHAHPNLARKQRSNDRFISGRVDQQPVSGPHTSRLAPIRPETNPSPIRGRPPSPLHCGQHLAAPPSPSATAHATGPRRGVCGECSPPPHRVLLGGVGFGFPAALPTRRPRRPGGLLFSHCSPPDRGTR